MLEYERIDVSEAMDTGNMRRLIEAVSRMTYSDLSEKSSL